MCCFIAMLLLQAQDNDRVSVGVYSYAFDKQYSFEVTKGQLVNSPVWKETEENPPLSARKAIELAKKMREKHVKDTDRYYWKFTAAVLQEASWNRWMWVVTFELEHKEVTSQGPRTDFRIIVLMNGTVVEPKVTDKKTR